MNIDNKVKKLALLLNKIGYKNRVFHVKQANKKDVKNRLMKISENHYDVKISRFAPYETANNVLVNEWLKISRNIIKEIEEIDSNYPSLSQDKYFLKKAS